MILTLSNIAGILGDWPFMKMLDALFIGNSAHGNAR